MSEESNTNVAKLDTISKLETAGFVGRDKCLRISLFEYGFAWKLDGEEYIFIYGISVKGTDYHRFDRCTLAKDLDVLREWDWVKPDRWFEFLDTHGYFPNLKREDCATKKLKFLPLIPGRYDEREQMNTEPLYSKQFQAWLDSGLPSCVADLVGYFGYENIFGSSYWEGFNIDEA